MPDFKSKRASQTVDKHFMPNWMPNCVNRDENAFKIAKQRAILSLSLQISDIKDLTFAQFLDSIPSHTKKD